LRTDRSAALLQPPSSSVDLSCPGLMVTANLSIVLGYLWLGLISTPTSTTSDTLGALPTALKGWVLPILITAAIVALRPACAKRRLRGTATLLPVVAATELTVSVVAYLTASRTLGFVAGGLAVVVGILAISAVLLREVHSKWPPDRLPADWTPEYEMAAVRVSDAPSAFGASKILIESFESAGFLESVKSVEFPESAEKAGSAAQLAKTG
jgi:hypothetical protein